MHRQGCKICRHRQFLDVVEVTISKFHIQGPQIIDSKCHRKIYSRLVQLIPGIFTPLLLDFFPFHPLHKADMNTAYIFYIPV